MFPDVVGGLIPDYHERLLHDDREIVGRKLLLQLLNMRSEISFGEAAAVCVFRGNGLSRWSKVRTACVSGRVIQSFKS